jgi:hypothetical protein
MGEWIDNAARALARGQTRRQVLKKLGGGVLGALVAFAAGHDFLAEQAAASPSQAAARCSGGRTACGKDCVDTRINLNHCGRCNNRCPAGTICRNGSCICPPGKAKCGDRCVNTKNDENNCGSCGNRCGGGRSCVNGTCRCPDKQTTCGGQCVDTASNNSHCGSCGNACSGGQVCVKGDCRCPGERTLCGGQCVNTQGDENNCGACGNRCNADTQVCRGGRCVRKGPGTNASTRGTDRLDDFDS